MLCASVAFTRTHATCYTAHVTGLEIVQDLLRSRVRRSLDTTILYLANVTESSSALLLIASLEIVASHFTAIVPLWVDINMKKWATCDMTQTCCRFRVVPPWYHRL
jgi:hypothetical protein